MPILSEFFRANDFADLQNVPMLFYPLNASAMTDGTQPGVLQPFRADLDGNLLVSIGIPGGGPLVLLPDDADDVTAVSTATRIPVVSRLYGLHEASDEWDRLRTDDDDLEASPADEDAALLRVMTRGRLYQNTDDEWQREKGQGNLTIASSAARTVTTVFGPFLNTNWRAAHYIVDVTAIAGDDIEVNIEGLDPVSSVFYPLLISPLIAATGTTVLKIGNGFTPISSLTANDMIPYTTRVRVVHSGASSITYSIGANFGV